MSAPFTADQLESLSAQIDRQLAELQTDPSTAVQKGSEPGKQDDPEYLPVQWRAIEKNAKEPPRSFWQRFRQAARRDLCEEGGTLYALWKKYHDLSNEDVLKSFGALLAGMGFSGNALNMLVVAVTVIVMHLGCKVICEEE